MHFTVKYMWNIRIIHSAVNCTLQSHIRFGFLVGALFTLQEENLSFQLKSSSNFFYLLVFCMFGGLFVRSKTEIIVISLSRVKVKPVVPNLTTALMI